MAIFNSYGTNYQRVSIKIEGIINYRRAFPDWNDAAPGALPMP